MSLAILVALGLRYAAIEPPRLSHFCQEAPAWWCLPRQLLIDALHANALGAAGVVIGIVALVGKFRTLGAITVAIAASGLVLYNFDWSAVALLLGLSAWLREGERDQPGCSDGPK